MAAGRSYSSAEAFESIFFFGCILLVAFEAGDRFASKEWMLSWLREQGT